MAESMAQQRGELVEAAQVLFRSGVMQHSGHGNLSAKVGEDRMLLTATGTMRPFPDGALEQERAHMRGFGSPH